MEAKSSSSAWSPEGGASCLLGAALDGLSLQEQGKKLAQGCTAFRSLPGSTPAGCTVALTWAGARLPAMGRGGSSARSMGWCTKGGSEAARSFARTKVGSAPDPPRPSFRTWMRVSEPFHRGRSPSRGSCTELPKLVRSNTAMCQWLGGVRKGPWRARLTFTEGP
jgi:hypothetical protein